MESDERRSTVDLISRILSVLSLCIALGAAGWLYTQRGDTGTQDKLVASFDQQLENKSQEFADARKAMEKDYQTALDRQDARFENWNTQLNDALTTFRQDADALLARIDENEKTASEQRQQAFRQALDDYTSRLATRDGAESSPLAGPKNQGDPADSPPEIAGETGSLDQLAEAATLKVVTTVMRPGTGNTTLIVIENTSAQDALIDRIRFRPEAEFETTDSPELSGDAATSSVTTVAYDTSDNRSNKPGYHGIYDRQLQQKIRVPAGERLTLRVLINDSQYEGWGFSGKLVVDYNGQEALTVESARVAFQGQS